MNWDAIGAVGEVLGAGLIAISLLYLARETRKSSRAVDATASRESSHQLAEWHREVARDPELMRITMKAISEEMPEYSTEEWMKLRLYFISIFQLYQSQYVHRGLDIGSVEESQKNINYASGLVSDFPAFAAMWTELEAEGNFLQGFVDEVNSASTGTNFTGILERVSDDGA